MRNGNGKSTKVIYISCDIGLKGSIVVLNDKGLPLNILKIPTIFKNSKEIDSNNIEEYDDINLQEFKVTDYKDPNRYINSKRKKYIRKSNKEKLLNGNGKNCNGKLINSQSNIKEVVKPLKKDEWYDVEKIKVFLNKISEHVQKDPSRIFTTIEIQNPFISKNRGSNKLLRGFGLIEGLISNICNYKNISFVYPKDWQSVLYKEFLNDDIISYVKSKNIDGICKIDSDLQDFFPDILANIINMVGKKSVNDTKILSILLSYYFYKPLLLSQKDNYRFNDQKKKNCYNIYQGISMIPDIEDFYYDMICYSQDHNICDAICMANYQRFLLQSKK